MKLSSYQPPTSVRFAQQGVEGRVRWVNQRKQLLEGYQSDPTDKLVQLNVQKGRGSKRELTINAIGEGLSATQAQALEKKVKGILTSGLSEAEIKEQFMSLKRDFIPYQSH